MFKAILKNTSYLLASEGVIRIITLLQITILVRYLGKNGYGILSLAAALPSMLLVITDLGLHSLIIREVSRDKEKLALTFQYMFAIKILLSVIFLGLVWSIVNILKYSDDVEFFIYLSSLSLICSSFQGLFSSLLRAIQKFLFDALLQVANALTLIGGVLIVVILDYGLEGIMYAQLLGQLMVVLICLAFYFRRYRFDYPLFSGLEQYLSILRKSLPFALIAIVLPVYYQINIVMLSKMSGYEVTGVFTAAYKIILMFMMLSRLLSQVLFPTLSNHFAVSIERFKKTFLYCHRGIAVVVFPVAFALFIIGDRIILILFEKEFLEALLPLQIMSFSLLFHRFT